MLVKTRTQPYGPTVRKYTVCIGCGKTRNGRAAKGWEIDQPVCPVCQEIRANLNAAEVASA